MDYFTYEVRVVSVEGDEEAEKVADRDNQLQKLIEGQNLQIHWNIFDDCSFTISSSPATSKSPSFFFL